MRHKLIGYSCLLLAGLLGLMALLTLFAMLRALSVPNTLAAVESAFGSFVLCLLLMLAARKAGLAGKARVQTGGLAQTERPNLQSTNLQSNNLQSNNLQSTNLESTNQKVAKPGKKDL